MKREQRKIDGAVAYKLATDWYDNSDLPFEVIERIPTIGKYKNNNFNQ